MRRHAPVLSPIKSRYILFLGFGGLLALMVFAGFDAVEALLRIQAANEAIRQEFLSRTRVLEQIRSDVYLSGTYVRDYLLDPEPDRAEEHKGSLIQARREMDAALATYRRLMSPLETGPFDTLTRQLSDFWRVLEPVFQWTPVQRKGGFEFLRTEVLPRRAAMLHIADQIAEVNERQLNAGRDRIAYLFAHSRNRLVVTMGITVGLGLLLAIFSVSKILRLEREAALRYEEISDARAELKRLSARLVEAQENERRSISRELHDEVGQSLTGVLLELANLSRGIRKKEPDEALLERTDNIKKLVENSVGVVRNMALLLRPSMLDDLGLIPALQWQAREVSKRTGVRVRVSAESVSDDLPEEHKTCIYRVVQEALHNASRHAEARQVRVGARQEADRILLYIQDDGKGFDPEQGTGMGLLGMQERVTHLGGTFRVESQPGQGTAIRIVLPVAREEVLKTQATA
ncbi:MAG TPA: ATP-binding protein [Bryobacteraceae bacterium]|nr:ATP-binding protein [Bryobacteraceae bacterium]